MPKLVVVVDKDGTGKLWNYVFTEEAVRNVNSFGTAPLWVHKSGSSGNSPQCVRVTEPTEGDNITLRLLLPRKEARANTRIKEK